jgi:tRNA (mo5U34)-methyltransferase
MRHRIMAMVYTPEEIEAKIQSVPNWYHRIEVAPSIVTPGINDTPTYFGLFNFPENCAGMRVLDIGTRDGYFAFEFERRGAEVLAVDYFPAANTGFAVAAELLGSKVTHQQANIYDISPAKHGTFDIVLMLGLIYHLPDPMLALDICRKVCRGNLYLETQVIDRAFLMKDGSFVDLASLNPELVAAPIMQFYPGDSLNKDFTNYWAPNEACMQRMLEENRFAVTRTVSNGPRALFECAIRHDPQLERFNKLSRGLI